MAYNPISPILLDSNNTTDSVLAAGATYTGTATEILNYQQAVINIYGTPSTAKASFYFEFSKDGTNWDVSVPHLIRNPSLVIPIPVITVHRYFRVKYINDGGTSAIAALGLLDTAGTPTLQTVFRLTTYLFPEATKELTRTIDQSISGSDPASLVIATGLGKQPDGDLVKDKADGTVFTTTSALGAGANFTSSWFDSDGWRSIELYVATDQVSGSDGIELQYTEDVEAGTPNVRTGPKRTFSTAEVTQGFAIFRFATALDGFRVKYTNGGTAQGSLMMQCNLHVTSVESPQSGIEAQLNATNTALMVRSVLNARNAAGTYANLERGTNNGLDVGIVQHEVSTPIKPGDNWQVTKTTLTTTPANIIAIGSGLTKRVSVEVYNADATKDIHIAPTTAGLTGGQFRTVAPGQGITMEISEAIGIAGKSASGSCSVEVVEISDTTLP